MELPFAEVVLSPRLHLRKAYVLERRPFLFAKSQTDCLGIRAPLKGRGGQTFPAHRSKARLEVEVETRQRVSSKRKGACGTWRAENEGEPPHRGRVRERDGETAAPFLPPHRSENSRKREKSAWRGATPPPSRQAKGARSTRG